MSFTKAGGVAVEKGLVLNRTNGECIKAMFGRDVDKWRGKRITLCVGSFNDEPCIRIRGSPDIAEPVTFDLKLPKKKPKRTRMERTTLVRTANAPAPGAPSDAGGEPDPDDVPFPPEEPQS